MKNRKTILFVALMFILQSMIISPAMAGEGTVGDYFGEIGTKFGRGLLNVVTSPAEIPCTIKTDMQDGEGNAAVGFFKGFGQGTLYFLRRLWVGVTEVGTFIIPMERTIPPVCTEPIV